VSHVRIAVLSDDRLFCEGLSRIIGAEGAFIAVGCEEGAGPRPALRGSRPHVLLVDSRMPGALGLCAARKREGGPPVILLAAPDDEEWALESLAAGARGILGKSARVEDLVKALHVVIEGQIWTRRHVLAKWIDRLAGGPPPEPSPAGRAGESLLERSLSRREREVFRHAATGLGNKELADRLSISQATVKVHLTHIFQKLGVHGRAELAAAYHGLSAPKAPTSPGTVVRLKA
jgi:DNA-binding NarL/FixJ family response regulator